MNATDTPSQLYTIRLEGPLTDAAARALGGTRRGNVEGETTILVEVRDRADLHGVLRRVEQSGLDLISVMPLRSRPTSTDREQEREKDTTFKDEPPSEEREPCRSR